MDSGEAPTVVITAALSVIGTLGVTYFGHWLGLLKDKELRQEELDRHARYLAIRVVCKLDPFVSDCCDVIYDTGLPDREGIMDPRVGDPTLSFPDDVDWKSVKPDLMYRVLGLPNELDIARDAIRFVGAEIAGPPDYEEYFVERTIRYGELGLAAFALANEIRQTYAIPKREYGSRNPKDTLEQSVIKAKKDRAESEARQAKFMDEIAEE